MATITPTPKSEIKRVGIQGIANKICETTSQQATGVVSTLGIQAAMKSEVGE
jgi:hypothetical protein